MSHTHYVILYHGKAREAGRFPRFFGLSSIRASVRLRAVSVFGPGDFYILADRIAAERRVICGMAKGYDNLIPLNRRSKDVQRAIQEKGRQANREKWKQKIDLRNSVQNFLNGDYTVDGVTMTGEEWFIEKVLEAFSNTKNQNWKAAAEIIVSLSESGRAGAEVERINAETEYTKAKTKLIQTETDDGGTGDDGLIEALNAAAIERGKRDPDES